MCVCPHHRLQHFIWTKFHTFFVIIRIVLFLEKLNFATFVCLPSVQSGVRIEIE